ncbi:hypothetical protein VTK26DRAFT_5844 [Humicola hyalothermophila]
MAAAVTRRRKTIGHRRRVEDDPEDEGGLDALADLDDDSVTDGSIGSDEHDPADDSDTSNIDDASPTSPSARKPLGNGAAKKGVHRQTDIGSVKSPDAVSVQPAVAETETMLDQLSLAGGENKENEESKPVPPSKGAAPIVVSSSSVTHQQSRLPQQELKRREHEEYRRRRDEDPTFVPNRGAFFLHDHRHAGPAANGFRPFPRSVRGRGRGAFGSHFAPLAHVQAVPDPITNGMWKHDMHEVIAEPPAPRQTNRYLSQHEGPPNGTGVIPTAPTSATPINRAMSTEKHIGNATIRVFIPSMDEPKHFPGIALKQYTKLPDHRPPLRRDKPVRISIPYHEAPLMPRYIFPASDRSFIFIPRAMRPNQQRTRGKGPRSVLGSGVFSRATSIWGGSVYGSVYSPSIALSRRSSIAPDIGREFMLSPTGSAISRPPLPVDSSRPVVRLPPLSQQPPVPAVVMPPKANVPDKASIAPETSISELPQPQTHPLPQKPPVQENRPATIPMHQPRPQKTVSVENIESPVQQAANVPTAYQQAFHQQVPSQLPNGFGRDTHTRNPSYQSQFSSNTPLSQIPERAIHAAPFQPNTYSQPGFFAQPYPTMQPQPGYYYPQSFGTTMAPNVNAPAFVPAAQQGQYAQSAQGDPAQQPAAAAPSSQNLVAQEINGMVYYYDPSQLPPMPPPPPPSFAPGPAGPYPAAAAPGGMMGMMAPSPDTTFYYQQGAPPPVQVQVPPQGMVYYPQ